MAIATLAEKRGNGLGEPDGGGKAGERPAGRGKTLEEIKLAVGEEMRGRNEVWYRVFFQETVGRRAYGVVHLVAFAGMVFLILDATLVYTDSPTLTTMESDSYPAREVDFPGVAICSTNKMSLYAVNELAQELHRMETTKIFNITLEQMRDLLKHLGHLYVFDVEKAEIEEAQLLHAILSRAYGDYNVRNLMMQLNPKCRYLLKHCSWEGMDRVCDNMFFLRKTQDGFCCTFNYARRNDDFGSAKRSGFVSSMVEKSTLINPEFGLQVVLNSVSDDYFYKSTPSNGFKILLFESLDYPDMSSGSLQEVWVPQNSEVFISVDARTFHTTPDVVEYDVSARNCLFNTEQNKIFQGYYSYSDCIMYCRIRDILSLCKCIPFFYPHPDNTDSARSCTLDDLMCLKEFIVKWRQVKPRPKKDSSLVIDDADDDAREQLNCDCFPSCDDVTYKISSSQIPLTAKKILWDREIIRNRNYSMLHIYFGGPNTIRLKQDVLFYWYELMSEYGGICSLFLGVSIINVIEIMYALANAALSRGGVIDRGDARQDIVGRMQDAKDAAPPAKASLMQDAAPRLNSVKVIDIGPGAAAAQLYWREFVKPRNKSIAPR